MDVQTKGQTWSEKDLKICSQKTKPEEVPWHESKDPCGGVSLSRTTKMALTHSTILSHPRGLNFLLLVKTGQKSDETLGYLQNTALTAGFVCNCLVRCLFVKPVLLPSQVQRRQAGKPNCIKCRLRFHLPAKFIYPAYKQTPDIICVAIWASLVFDWNEWCLEQNSL